MEFYSGADLDEWLGEARYRDVLELTLQLPDPYSRFRAALNEDRELWEMIYGTPDDVGIADENSGAGLPYQLIGTPEHLMLNVQDRLDMVISLMGAQLSKKKPKKVKPTARPLSMDEKIREEREQREADELLEFLGINE